MTSSLPRDPGMVAERLVSRVYPDASVRILSETHRRHSRLAHLAVGGEDDVIVKFADGVTAEGAARTSALAAELSGILSDFGEEFDVVPIITSTDDPPALVMKYVAGTDLSTVIAHGARRGSTPHEWRRALRLVRAAGRGLGAIHRLDPTLAENVEFSDHLRRRFRLSQSWAAKADCLAIPVRSVVDFAPYNLRIASGDELRIVDVPPERPGTSAHHDCAGFLVGAMRSVYELPLRMRRRPRRARRQLEASFLAGYASSAPRSLDSVQDQRLLDLEVTYQATNIMVKLARRPSAEHYVIAAKLLPFTLAGNLRGLRRRLADR